MRISIAFRAWWRALTDRSFADRIAELLTGPPAAEALPPVPRETPSSAVSSTPKRSEALTLLAALQREARFVDLVKEPLDNYSDAQIGAAARDVLRDCGAVLDRMFLLQPVLEQEEGTTIEVPPGFDANKYRLTGNVEGQPPFHGRLVHHGWEASRCQLPQWTGTVAAQMIVAPVEVEVVTAAGTEGNGS